MVFLCLLPHLPLVTTFPVQYFWSYRRLDFSRYYHRPRVLLRSHFAFVRLRLQIFSRSTSVPISATINTGLSAFITGYKFSRAYVFLFTDGPPRFDWLIQIVFLTCYCFLYQPDWSIIQPCSLLTVIFPRIPRGARQRLRSFYCSTLTAERSLHLYSKTANQSIITFIKLFTNQQITERSTKTDCPWVSQ